MAPVVFVVDGVAVGALPDAADYGDAGSDTLGNLSRAVCLRLPFLQRLGLGNIAPLMGLVTSRPFPTYPQASPRRFSRPSSTTGGGVLRNRPASGTGIVAELGISTWPPANPSSARLPTACSGSPRTWMWCPWRSCTPGARQPGSCCSGVTRRPRSSPGRSRGRVGPEEAAAAGRWLQESVGTSPHVAVILGSGLTVSATRPAEAEFSYQGIPHWRVGGVPGHPQKLAVTAVGSRRMALLCGRIHEYEGFDLGEVQLPVRTLAAWGVRGVVVTSAGGAVRRDLAPGSVVVTEQVLDLQYRGDTGAPELLEATDPGLLDAVGHRCGAPTWLRRGVHASVPGPQYETPAELCALRAAGVATVSMTPAAELRAARDVGLKVAVVTVVTNVGDTTHATVLKASGRAADALTQVVTAVADAWEAGA